MTFADTIKGSNAERSRSLNRQAVLGRIQSAGEMGRAEVARSLGLSTQAVSNIIADLERDGMLETRGTRSIGRGLPAVLYGVNPSGGYALGVEIRPDAVFTALLDLKGHPVATSRHTLKSSQPANIVGKILKLRDEMLTKTGVAPERLMGAGIVMPGPFGSTGISGLGSDLPDWQAVDPVQTFTEALDLPVEVSNDANAAAMAERIGGVAQNISSFAYLYFGAGLGLGLVDQGRLVTGAFGNAGEIGHIPIPGKNGVTSLENRLSRVSVQDHLSALGPLDFAALERLHEARDPRLLDWLAQASVALSSATLIIENLFDPQTIILGGAMPKPILEHLIADAALPPASVSARSDNPVPRLQCGASGRLTATLGAASLILNRAFTPQTAAL